MFGASKSANPSDWRNARDPYELTIKNYFPDVTRFKLRLTVFDGSKVYKWQTKDTYKINTCIESKDKFGKGTLDVDAPMPNKDDWKRVKGPFYGPFQFKDHPPKTKATIAIQVVSRSGNTISDGKLSDHTVRLHTHIVDTPSLEMSYVPVKITSKSRSPLPRHNWFRGNPTDREKYLKDTFPLSEGDLTTSKQNIFLWCGNGWGWGCKYDNIVEFQNTDNDTKFSSLKSGLVSQVSKKFLKGGTDRIVVVFNNLWQMPAPGWTWPGKKVVFIRSDWGTETLSHEIMHTFDINTEKDPNLNRAEDYGDIVRPKDDEIKQGDVLGIEANGYWVNEKESRDDTLSSMGVQINRDHWIKKPTYLTLLDKFAGESDPPDPKLLLVSGTLYKNGTFDPTPFYTYNGTPNIDTTSKGNYTFSIENSTGKKEQFEFDVDFQIHVLNKSVQDIDSVPILFSIPIEDGIESISLHDPTSKKIFERNKTSNAPSFSLVSPKPNQGLSNNSTVRWQTNDVDGDRVGVTVLAKKEGKTEWNLLTADSTDNSVNVGNVSGNVSLSFFASDGINTVERTFDFNSSSFQGTFDIFTSSPVSPGKNVSISINASNTGGVSIGNIPENWSIESTQNDNGIFTVDDPDNDGHNEGAGWAWANTGNKNPSVILNLPGNEDEGNFTLNATIQNGNQVTKQFTIEVREIDYDEDNDGNIDSNEVRNAIRDFLFNQKLNSNQVKDIIRRFLFG